MTCGLCHRNPDDHPLSTSGPTRCKYLSHRSNCPGTFSTRCSDHVVDGVTAPPETEHKSEAEPKVEIDSQIKTMEHELKAFNLNQEQAPQLTPSPGTPLQAPPVLATGQGPSAAETEFKTPHPPQTTWGQSQPVLPDIEKMVRDHVANNQQHLSQQPAPQGSYSGPNMAEIRKDPNVQAQADLIMNAIKASCPVYGQNQPANPTLPGINPLQQRPGPNQ